MFFSSINFSCFRKIVSPIPQRCWRRNKMCAIEMIWYKNTRATSQEKRWMTNFYIFFFYSVLFEISMPFQTNERFSLSFSLSMHHYVVASMKKNEHIAASISYTRFPIFFVNAYAPPSFTAFLVSSWLHVHMHERFNAIQLDICQLEYSHVTPQR